MTNPENFSDLLVVVCEHSYALYSLGWGKVDKIICSGAGALGWAGESCG